MSWQQGQQFARTHGQGRPLAAMTAAVLSATQKPLVEQSLKDLIKRLDDVPSDIDWLSFQAGVQRYASQQFVHSRPEFPEVARIGRVCLRNAGGSGPTVVLVPSMVNRGYILDLYPGQSLVEHLRNAGMHVLLVDWGDPTSSTILTLENIIAGHLEPLIVAAAAQSGGPVSVFGYCMGGLLAVAATARLGKEKVTKLAVAAMPWDFSQTTSSQHMHQGRQVLQPWLNGQQILPPEVMAQYFWLLEPWGPIRRVMAYGKETDPEKLKFLTVLEDWLADGLGLDGPIAREMLMDWYADNTPLTGRWLVDGKLINPATLTMPLWICLTQKDVLVPLPSSLPFVGQTKGAQVIMSDTGHVGLVCGRRAKTAFYEPLTTFLNT